MAQRGRILVVDDEPVIVDLLVTVLKDERFDLLSFTSGVAARDAIRAGGVDVLVTDKNMPEVSGLDLVVALREADPDAQAIIVTGYPSIETLVTAMQLEVFDYVVKPPPNIFDVRRKVERALEKTMMLRENRRLLLDLRGKNEALEAALAELRQVQDELVRTEKLAGIGTLAAGVAHEVSSPLFGILGLAEAITDESDLATAQAHAREIVGFSRQIRDIVADLTRYSRIDDRDLAPMALAPSVDDAVRLVCRTAPYPLAAVAVDVPADVALVGRPGEVQQVVVNLVKNAIEAAEERHGPGGGRVEVLGRTDGREATLEVRDDGAGVPADVRGRVFDPFYTTKEPGKGTGLGLNVVYRIVTRLRGTVSVGDRPGGGAVFTVRWPAAAA